MIGCLLLATSVGGYLRTAHDLARAGQVSLVICGQDGASVVTLDRNGTPVSPGPATCDHCADCSLIADFDLPVIADLSQAADPVQEIAYAIVDTIPVTSSAGSMARGPPVKSKV
ncbi:hypothetical protein [Pseudooceanicola sp.]|uniref:hypothetical protein n=1 Tax=Pseudooceanicola sp. TaxID=1914328 RepID=UPI002615F5D2|nr:hypothetical protein [Pseudooceanicola sp.]MDF1856037.1 hypothetical protein [Pseudooceanicola sp.]